MPRFAILGHDHPQWHWDFLLEEESACRTWRLSVEPGIGRAIPAETIADHRLMYLTYEGPVGGNRGIVAQWDSGDYEWIRLDAGEFVVRLAGRRLECECRLISLGDTLWRAEFGAVD